VYGAGGNCSRDMAGSICGLIALMVLIWSFIGSRIDIFL